VARNARRYGGAAGLSGGLIGPPGRDFAFDGALAGTEVFLGCSDVDPHIPVERVEETTRVLTELGASVTERIYPGMGHIINADEIEHVRAMMSR
jgi:predicted esterase